MPKNEPKRPRRWQGSQSQGHSKTTRSPTVCNERLGATSEDGEIERLREREKERKREREKERKREREKERKREREREKRKRKRSERERERVPKYSRQSSIVPHPIGRYQNLSVDSALYCLSLKDTK